MHFNIVTIITVICLFITTLQAALHESSHCSAGCACYQRTVRCSNAQLNSVPSHFSHDTNTVDLSFNRINQLSANAFNGLSLLTTLFLSGNELDQVNDGAFNGLVSLRFLYLNNNRISHLPTNVFANLFRVEAIYLENNILRQIDERTFNNLPHLSRLFLNNNQLTNISPTTFGNVLNLKQLHLHANPINCNCGVHALWNLWLKNPKRNNINVTLNCDSPPNLSGYDFQSLQEQHFQCADEESDVHNEILSLVITQRPITLSPVASNVPNHPLYFTQKPRDQTVSVNSAIPILLDCAVNYPPTPEIQWFFNERRVTQSSINLRVLSNGSLVLTQPTPQASGVYRCEAISKFGKIVADAHIHVIETPVIILAPQSQTVKLGKPFTLECDADGNPTINWLFRGVEIKIDDHLVLENENTELVIKRALESDAGVYSCVVENAISRLMINATIIVKGVRHAPQFLIEPYDLEAFSGTSIELPCKSDENDGVQIEWRKDGRSINANVARGDKFEISAAGSLFVKNVTILDTGRYECSVRNEYGRSTASALITIKNSVDLAPGDRYVRIAFAQAASEIDLAINNTIELLFSKRNESTNKIPRIPGELLRVFRFPKGEARQLARAAEIYERTLVNIRKHVLVGDNLTIESDKYEYRDLLSRDHLHLVAELSGCHEPREMPNCTDMCYHSLYRSIDGTCNNLLHPMWGSSLTAFRRMAPPIYEDGFSMPIGWTKGKLYAGYTKPSARLVSTTLVSTKEITPDERITHMVMQWGQFLDHDLDHAIPSVSSESWDGVDCKKTCDFAPPCYPIEVPPNDPRVHNRRCIDVVRSSAICGSGMTSVFFDNIQHREQINQLTAYIDASQMYGYSAPFAQELRNLSTDDGLLRVGVHFPNQKDMLPFAAPQDGMDCRRNLDENTMNCFVSGDIRVNEQIGLLAMHTIWMREHNRIAIKLREINPHWDGDTIYQEARKIVGAQMQHITYQQWLPLIIGKSGMDLLGPYTGYNSSIEAAIANEFATAALRFGHTLINPLLHRLDENFQPIQQGHLPLHKAFFAPWRLPYEGGVDPLMRGMFAVAAKLKTPTQNLNMELTEKLFHTAHAVALDLAAINIQRGRDHGIPGYNVYRQQCNMKVAVTFDDLRNEISSEEVRQKLKELYGHPDNIDIWLGGVLEDQVEDGKVGPLFQCLLVEQFKRLRDGDRFYYENPGVFIPQQLEQIRQTNLGRVLCDVGDNIKQVTKNVFIMPEQQGGFQQCNNIPGINLFLWQDCGACNSLPPLFDTYIPETYVKTRNKRSLPTNVKSNVLDIYEVNEERINGLEQVIGDFQRELRKVQKQIQQLEQSCNVKDRNEMAAADHIAKAFSPK